MWYHMGWYSWAPSEQERRPFLRAFYAMVELGLVGQLLFFGAAVVRCEADGPIKHLVIEYVGGKRKEGSVGREVHEMQHVCYICTLREFKTSKLSMKYARRTTFPFVFVRITKKEGRACFCRPRKNTSLSADQQ